MPIPVNRDALKGLGIGIALILFQQFSANFPIVCYSVMVYQKAGTSIDPYTSSIITAGLSIFLSALKRIIIGFCAIYNFFSHFF